MAISFCDLSYKIRQAALRSHCLSIRYTGRLLLAWGEGGGAISTEFVLLKHTSFPLYCAVQGVYLADACASVHDERQTLLGERTACA